MEPLGLALNEDIKLRGCQLPGNIEKPHKFSAFADDATVYLCKTKDLKYVQRKLNKFGEISGLRIQPTKSQYIFLNTAIKQINIQGIPVLRMRDVTRYLGIYIGVGEIKQMNWELRCQTIERRLVTAVKLGLSIIEKVIVLNTIVLPSILFTAAYFQLSATILTKLENLQKQFLWNGQISTR